jgi:hypothetical protein
VSTSLTIALDLAATGLPVFPCGGDKRPAIPKPRGGNGFKDASTDPRRVREMWDIAGLSARLVGVPTGAASGFDALDFDPRHGSGDWRAAHIHRLLETRVHLTPSGGEHWLWRHVDGVTNSASKIAPGVDVRGDGGYVIMPPSPGYQIIREADVSGWPWWLLRIILNAAEPPPRPAPSGYTAPPTVTDRRIEAFVRAALDAVAAARDGEKHYRLRNAALQLGGIAARADLDDATATTMLIVALPGARNWDAARKTIAWGLAEGRKRPITLPDREHAEWRRRA